MAKVRVPISALNYKERDTINWSAFWCPTEPTSTTAPSWARTLALSPSRGDTTDCSNTWVEEEQRTEEAQRQCWTARQSWRRSWPSTSWSRRRDKKKLSAGATASALVFAKKSRPAVAGVTVKSGRKAKKGGRGRPRRSN